MPPEDRPLRKALGERGGDELLREHGKDARTRDARHDRHEEDRDAEGGQHEVPEHVDGSGPAARVRAQRDHALRRQPAEIDREQDDEKLSEPEDRHRIPEQAERRDAGVQQAARARCGGDAQRDPDQGSESQGRHHEEQRDPGPAQEERQHRLTVREGVPEVPGQQVLEISPELDGQGLIEPEVAPDLLEVPGGRREVAHERLDRISRREVDDEEVDDDDDADDRHRPGEPGEDDPPHAQAAARRFSVEVRSASSSLQSSSSSRRSTVRTISWHCAAPSTGTMSDSTFSASSRSESGFSGAPLANSIARSMVRPSASWTSRGGYSPMASVRSGTTFVSAISRRISGSCVRSGTNWSIVARPLSAAT